MSTYMNWLGKIEDAAYMQAGTSDLAHVPGGFWLSKSKCKTRLSIFFAKDSCRIECRRILLGGKPRGPAMGNITILHFLEKEGVQRARP